MLKYSKTITKETDDEIEYLHEFDIKISYNPWTITLFCILGGIIVCGIGIIFGGWRL